MSVFFCSGHGSLSPFKKSEKKSSEKKKCAFKFFTNSFCIFYVWYTLIINNAN